MARSRPSRPRSSRWRRGIGCLGASAVIALAGVGCGSSANNKAGSGLDRANLVKRADAICKPHFEKVTVAANKILAGGKLPDPRQFGRLAMQTIIPEYSAQIAELRALKPADDVAADYRKLLSTSEATLAKIKRNPALITSGANFKAVNAQAKALGLSKQCQVGPS